MRIPVRMLNGAAAPDGAKNGDLGQSPRYGVHLEIEVQAKRVVDVRGNHPGLALARHQGQRRGGVQAGLSVPPPRNSSKCSTMRRAVSSPRMSTPASRLSPEARCVRLALVTSAVMRSTTTTLAWRAAPRAGLASAGHRSRSTLEVADGAPGVTAEARVVGRILGEDGDPDTTL